MATITKKGRELADALAPSYNPHGGLTVAILETCSLICRHATTLHVIQERWCSEEMSERTTKALERRESALEARVSNLCEALPHIDGKPVRARFNGDPRGPSVLLVMPDGRTNDWGQRGICVPCDH